MINKIINKAAPPWINYLNLETVLVFKILCGITSENDFCESFIQSMFASCEQSELSQPNGEK